MNSLALRPAGSLGRPKQPLSRGFSPSDCSSKPLVSYQINRQLSGWNLPLAMRALGGRQGLTLAADIICASWLSLINARAQWWPVPQPRG